MSRAVRNSPEIIKKFLKEHKYKFVHPECYLGNEPNTHHKDWDEANFRILIAGLWRYEDNRGNQTLSLLYQMINEHYGKEVVCERAFMPNTEKEYKLFRDHRIPIFGLESKHGMAEYDMILTSLSYVPPWINFPLMLEMSDIPLRWKDRPVGFPKIMIGGSAMYGNFSLVYPVVDMIYLGDAESGLFDVLDHYKKYWNLHTLQQEFDYVFCTHFYIPKYDKEKFVEWQTVPHLRKEFKVTICENLDEAPALTKPIPSYTDSSMGLGELELSRGCRASCVYCGIGWKYRPYRERSPEKFVELIAENRKNSGTYKGLCPISTEFAYYTHKRGLFNKLRALSATVDPLSMRIDAFSKDPEFALALAGTGMNNLAIGMEGISQRLRNRLMKGITEEEILEVCRIAIESGAFNKIKFFLISNIDEEWEDYEEFFSLLRKINEMKGRVKSKLQIKVSWTPLFVEPCTPLQWKKPTIEQRQPWMKISKILDELGVKYPRGGGGKNQESFLWVMQGMHLGDARFAEALLDTTLEVKRPFYVSHTKKMKEVLSRHLASYGYSWEYLLRERKLDEVFPWDIVKRRVSKNALRSIYKKIVNKELDNKVQNVKVYVDTHIPLIRKEINYEESTVGWILQRFLINNDVVPNTQLIAQIHRAAYMTNFPLTVKSLHFNGDRAHRNWYLGNDFVFMGLNFSIDSTWLTRLNDYLIDISFPPLSFKELGLKKPKYSNFFGVYEIETGMTDSQLTSYFSEIESKKKVEILAPETRYFSGERKKIFDLKAPGVFYDLENDSGTVRLKLYDKLGIRYFLKGLFHNVGFSRILKYSIRKTNICVHRATARGSFLEEIF